MLGDEVIEGGSRIETTQEYALKFAQAGMDFISLSKEGVLKMLYPRVRQPILIQVKVDMNAYLRFTVIKGGLLDEIGP